MDEMKINLELPSGKNFELVLTGDTYAYEIIDQVTEEGFLSPLNDEKNTYAITFAGREAKELDMDATLEDNNVRDGDTLRVFITGMA